MWISPKTLCSPVLTSFADSIYKLLDFSQAFDSMTSRIKRTLCVACYIWYVNPQHMRFMPSCINRRRWPPPLPSSLNPLVSFRRSWDDRGFISTLRVCMFSCHAMCILVVPFDSLANKALYACMHGIAAVLGPK